MQEGGVWPYANEGPMSYHPESSFSNQELHRTMGTYPDPMPPNYGSPYHDQDPLFPYNGPPQYIPLSPDQGPPQHYPYGTHNGPPSSYFSEDHALHSGLPPHYDYDPQLGDGFHSHVPPYQHEFGSFGEPSALESTIEESDSWEEEEDEDGDEEEEEDEASVALNSFEEVLQKVNIQLPRLAVTAPPSVLPPKGQGLSGLPNLGNTCYLSAVVQCLYHTPALPALLAEACVVRGGEGKRRNVVAHALNSLMTKMDDVKKVRKGELAFFKGVCGLRDDQFAGVEQQEAHDFLAGLLQWLHKDLASQEEVDCACTKTSTKTKKCYDSTTPTDSNTNKKDRQSTTQGSSNQHHHQTQEHRPPKQPQQQDGYQYRPPTSQDYPPNFNIYPGSTHSNSLQPQAQHSYASNHNHLPQQSLGDNLNYNHNGQLQHNQHPQYRPRSNQHHPLSNKNYYHHQHFNDENHTGLSDHHQNSSKNQQMPKKMSKASLQSKTGQEGEVCERCGVTYQYRSLISDMFEGICQQDIICPKNGFILTSTWERFTSLSLPVSGSSEITLEEALQQYFRISMFMWDCYHCNSNHLCHQQMRIVCAPPILIIHISRYVTRHNLRKQSVIFPKDGLSLQEHMKVTKGRAQQYGVFGVCNHHGTRQEGHYTACCKVSRGHDERADWYSFDDEELAEVTHFRHPRNAHILFYCSYGFKSVHP